MKVHWNIKYGRCLFYAPCGFSGMPERFSMIDPKFVTCLHCKRYLAKPRFNAKLSAISASFFPMELISHKLFPIKK